jgi:Glyoxalase-like domain
MTFAVDHAFVACTPGAPEGDALVALGFVEGSGNTHPGQGTANRRFFFANFMLELLWVVDPAQATSEQTRGTRLWERCPSRQAQVNPFGIVFRPAGEHASPAPFETWAYYPSYLPAGASIQFAAGTTLHEPELIYLPFLRKREFSVAEPIDHAVPVREIRGLCVGLQRLQELSGASRAAARAGLVTYVESSRDVLEILFAAAADLRFDLRPALPLLFRSVA